ncbi:MAG: rhomboid family intramembrane serine protease [Acidobacteria bacterium]|nr:rhomboid family intramembrane serine protease [Acidobacteriota bacterium]MBI3425884.1 rhomboid family intramembrane serine protease [Acidobacteriota bacterium]
MNANASLQHTPKSSIRTFVPHPVVNAIQSFQVCRHCKKPTPAREPLCVNCGMRRLSTAALNAQTQIERRFLAAFFARETPVAYALFLANLLVYLLIAALAGGSPFENLLHGVDGPALLAFGAKTNAALLDGEYFRLVTPIFLHLSGLHLLSNSFALAIVGPQVERLYGSVRFLLIYLLAGLGGLLSSVLAHALSGKPHTVAVGASGAIFGLFGVLAVFSFKYRAELPAAFINSFAIAVLPAIAVNLFIGFTVPFIDNSIHMGGLLAGAGLAFIIPYLAPGRERVTWRQVELIAACTFLVTISFVRAYQVRPRYMPAVEQTALQLNR